MSLPNPLDPKPKTVTINGATYRLMAFYYPDYDTPWDVVYQGQFLTNFYPIKFTFTHNGITGSFNCAEAAFQALKWWNTPHRQQFEGISGKAAYHVKTTLHNADYSYAGFWRRRGRDDGCAHGKIQGFRFAKRIATDR